MIKYAIKMNDEREFPSYNLQTTLASQYMCHSRPQECTLYGAADVARHIIEATRSLGDYKVVAVESKRREGIYTKAEATKIVKIHDKESFRSLVKLVAVKLSHGKWAIDEYDFSKEVSVKKSKGATL
jgi:FlaA1/EpsC-like NDP-sugar epimerase